MSPVRIGIAQRIMVFGIILTIVLAVVTNLLLMTPGFRKIRTNDTNIVIDNILSKHREKIEHAADLGDAAELDKIVFYLVFYSMYIFSCYAN